MKYVLVGYNNAGELHTVEFKLPFKTNEHPEYDWVDDEDDDYLRQITTEEDLITLLEQTGAEEGEWHLLCFGNDKAETLVQSMYGDYPGIGEEDDE